MVNGVTLSAASCVQLQKRALNTNEIDSFQSLLNDAAEEMRSTGQSARQVIQHMNTDELRLLQKANSLAFTIQADALSEEGATNLLRQPDGSDRVDLNNDGLVEVGAGKIITFPPVNAPAFVKQAWDRATATMSEGDKLLMQFHMHTAIYGLHADGLSNPAVPASPEKQWSADGIAKLFERLRGGLEFAVSHSGWTENLKMQEEFYDRFESALG